MLLRAVLVLSGALGMALAFSVALAAWAYNLWRRP